MHRRKLNVSSLLFRVIVFLGMTMFALSFIFSIGWIVMQAFNTPLGFMKQPFSIPDMENVSVSNFVKAFSISAQRTTFWDMLLNSIILIAIEVFFGCLFLPPLCGYILARYNFPGKKLLLTIIIITAAIPTVGNTPITYRLIVDLGLMDTFWGIIIQRLNCFGFGMIIQMNLFRSLDKSLMEAAAMDGAGRMRTYLSVMLPQAKGLILVQSILQIIGSWNDYMTAYIYLPSRPNLAYGLNLVKATVVNYGQDYPTMFAYMIFMIVVVFVIYVIFSKKINTQMYASALK